MKTFVPKVDKDSKKWFLVDAEGKTLGRIATKIAAVLRGKHTPQFSPDMDTGDFVVVVNAEKVNVTGKKESDKIYYHHTGYIGGIKGVTLGKLRDTKPEEVIKKAVWGMLPSGPLARDMFSKLKVYAGPTHPHEAQKPLPLQ
ncbi:MAG: 50S ribosomal protein L13 [Thermodesulfobacteriota bacterium]